MFQEERLPAEDIAAKVGADPATVSAWLKKHGVEIHQGLHRKEREPPKVSAELAALLSRGPDEALRLLEQRVWGITASEKGHRQLSRYCGFIKLPLPTGRNEAATRLDIDRSMVKAWTYGTKQPYLVRAANAALQKTPRLGWKLLSLCIGSGGNLQGPWMEVPSSIQGYEDISAVIRQVAPIDCTFERAARYGITRQQLERMREDLFSYLLAFLAGDASKGGGLQERFASSNIDLHLTLKQPTNERLGDFVCMCANSLGIAMDRKRDKQPSGSSRFGKHPSAAYRWTSKRSPFVAWMFNVGLGLQWGQCTTLDCLRMEWIFKMPRSFRLRFMQGIADSDGGMKPYEVVITSVPNSDLITRLLQSLGMKTAHVISESGKDLRTMVNAREAASLPIFNEFVKSYRYQRLMEHV